MKMAQRKRLLSVFMMACGLSLHFVAITTEYWWQQAVPVRSPAEINKSVVYFWKGLHEVCTQAPKSASGPTCKKLETVGLETGECSLCRKPSVGLTFVLGFVKSKELFKSSLMFTIIKNLVKNKRSF